ncbi:hypothetical protein MA16_Dca016862 [Dendrobium catenatum]|uniref:Uncharacterized protein n=1 Tax=Dendrobium catenatum TaxID=906689 RepID=A0A2I0WNQ6_9ASPA|nr:hypothetical protein MA16_Dca016862 [Dendrobium catenatum]
MRLLCTFPTSASYSLNACWHLFLSPECPSSIKGRLQKKLLYADAERSLPSGDQPECVTSAVPSWVLRLHIESRRTKTEAAKPALNAEVLQTSEWASSFKSGIFASAVVLTGIGIMVYLRRIVRDDIEIVQDDHCSETTDFLEVDRPGTIRAWHNIIRCRHWIVLVVDMDTYAAVLTGIVGFGDLLGYLSSLYVVNDFRWWSDSSTSASGGTPALGGTSTTLDGLVVVTEPGGDAKKLGGGQGGARRLEFSSSSSFFSLCSTPAVVLQNSIGGRRGARRLELSSSSSFFSLGYSPAMVRQNSDGG